VRGRDDGAHARRRVERGEAQGEGTPRVAERRRDRDRTCHAGRAGRHDDPRGSGGHFAGGFVHASLRVVVRPRPGHRERRPRPGSRARERFGDGSDEGCIAGGGHGDPSESVRRCAPALELHRGGGRRVTGGERLPGAASDAGKARIGERLPRERRGLAADRGERGLVAGDGLQQGLARGQDDARRIGGRRDQRAQAPPVPAAHRRCLDPASGEPFFHERGERHPGEGAPIVGDTFGRDGHRDGALAVSVAYDRFEPRPVFADARGIARSPPRADGRAARDVRRAAPCRQQEERVQAIHATPPSLAWRAPCRVAGATLAQLSAGVARV
jgi:hypothetical protein